MGSTAIRKVKGNDYLYYIHYENGIKKTVYCGLVSRPESKRKAKELEIKDLEKQKEQIIMKLKNLKS